MPEPHEESLDQLRARLTAARDERDRLEEEVERAWARVLSITSRRSYRAAVRLRRALPRSASLRRRRRMTDDRPGLPLLPIPRGVLIDVSTLDESVRSGISRVTVELARATAAQVGGVTLARPTPQGWQAAPDLLDEVGTARPTDVAGRAPLLISATVHPGHLLEPLITSVEQVQDAGGRYVQVIHDVLPITEPDFFPRGMREHFPRWLTAVTARADRLVCVSEATRQELLANVTVPSERVSVVPPAAFLRPADHETARSPGSVLTVGTVEPRKGVEALLEVAVAAAGWSVPVTFTLVGRAGWNSERLIARLRAADRDPQVPFEWRENVTDSELATLYRSSALVFQPSRAEGFGLPLVEALAAATPVLTRDIPVFRESVSDDASFFASDADMEIALRGRLAAPEPSTPARPGWDWSEAAAAILTAASAAERR